jgi:hypothetical protein
LTEVLRLSCSCIESACRVSTRERDRRWHPATTITTRRATRHRRSRVSVREWPPAVTISERSCTIPRTTRSWVGPVQVGVSRPTVYLSASRPYEFYVRRRELVVQSAHVHLSLGRIDSDLSDLVCDQLFGIHFVKQPLGIGTVTFRRVTTRAKWCSSASNACKPRLTD